MQRYDDGLGTMDSCPKIAFGKMTTKKIPGKCPFQSMCIMRWWMGIM